MGRAGLGWVGHGWSRHGAALHTMDMDDVDHMDCGWDGQVQDEEICDRVSG